MIEYQFIMFYETGDGAAFLGPIFSEKRHVLGRGAGAELAPHHASFPSAPGALSSPAGALICLLDMQQRASLWSTHSYS